MWPRSGRLAAEMSLGRRESGNISVLSGCSEVFSRRVPARDVSGERWWGRAPPERGWGGPTGGSAAQNSSSTPGTSWQSPERPQSPGREHQGGRGVQHHLPEGRSQGTAGIWGCSGRVCGSGAVSGTPRAGSGTFRAVGDPLQSHGSIPTPFPVGVGGTPQPGYPSVPIPRGMGAGMGKQPGAEKAGGASWGSFSCPEPPRAPSSPHPG